MKSKLQMWFSHVACSILHVLCCGMVAGTGHTSVAWCPCVVVWRGVGGVELQLEGGEGCSIEGTKTGRLHNTSVQARQKYWD
eukprot:428552-Pelagomonas_calceolata.AAC.1